LNEIQSLLSLGLQSKEGALRELGEEFPAAVLQEIRKELIDDAVADGALRLVQTEIDQEIMSMTGQAAPADGTTTGGGAADGAAAPGSAAGAEAGPAVSGAAMDPQTMGNLQLGEAELRNRLVTEAYGTRLPTRNVPQDYQK
jgi:hypothetical protein